MYAYRTTWYTTQANKQKAIDGLIAVINKEKKHATSWPLSVRVYAPELSPNVIVYEEVWETPQEHDAWWAAINARHQEDRGGRDWYDLVEHASSTYRWIVTEWR